MSVVRSSAGAVGVPAGRRTPAGNRCSACSLTPRRYDRSDSCALNAAWATGRRFIALSSASSVGFIAAYYDEFAGAEWDRLVSGPAG